MNSIYDVQQLLKKFGTFIYTGNRQGDLHLMELEMQALYEQKLIPVKTYYAARLCIRKELQKLGDKGV